MNETKPRQGERRTRTRLFATVAVAMMGLVALSGLAHASTTTYSPAFFAGFGPATTSAMGAGNAVNATSVFVDMLPPNDLQNTYASSYAGGWNDTLTVYTGLNHGGTGGTALVSLGFTLTSLGTFVPMWSDKLLTRSVSTCQAGGQTTANNHASITTNPLGRGLWYNFSITLSANGTWINYAVTGLNGRGVAWSGSNSTGGWKYDQLKVGFHGVACPFSNQPSGFDFTNVVEQVNIADATFNSGNDVAPPYTFYSAFLGEVPVAGGYVMDDKQDAWFVDNSAPTIAFVSSPTTAAGGYVFDRIGNEAYSPWFGTPSSLVFGTFFSGFTTYTNVSVVVQGYMSSASGVQSHYCGWISNNSVIASVTVNPSSGTGPYWWNATFTAASHTGVEALSVSWCAGLTGSHYDAWNGVFVNII